MAAEGTGDGFLEKWTTVLFGISKSIKMSRL